MKTIEFSKALNLFKKSGIPDSVNFEVMNEILISHHSTAIEGSSLTEQESRLLLLEGITAPGKPLSEHNMVMDHQKALVFTLEQATQKTPVTNELIQKINALVMKNTGGEIHSIAGSHDSSKGDFRRSMVHVGDRYFSNYQKVPGEVAEVCKFINDNVKKTVDTVAVYNLAFDIHFNLVSIHPFADGNGRTSRLMSNYVLHYHNLPLSIVFKEDRGSYFQALEDTRKNSNIQIFRDFMFLQQEKYFLGEIQKIDNGIKKSVVF
jgi:Fic family protein